MSRQLSGRARRGLSSKIALLAIVVAGVVATAPLSAQVSAQCFGQDATIVLEAPGLINGTDGDDVIVGSPGDDVIRSGAGDDLVCAGDGDDIVLGSTGNDVIDGQGGADDLVGGPNTDEIYGGDGDDRIRGTRGSDSLFGDAGDDEISGGQDTDLVRGGDGDDVIRGGIGADDLRGDEGDDRVAGGGANDTVRGGAGNDDIVGGHGPTDELFGGAGVDVCTDRGSNTQLNGCELDGLDTTSPVDGEPPIAPERVIHISIDGLRSDHVTPEISPVLELLMADGASTLNARTDPAQTRTLPNHTAQLTGRFVWGDGGHRTTFNEDDGTTVHETAGLYIPSVFDVVHDNGGSTLLYAGKEKFEYLERSYSVAGRVDATGADDGTDKIDRFVRGAPESLVDAFVQDVAAVQDETTYAFYHIRLPDEFGHIFGWGSLEYRLSVTDSDRLVGDIIAGLAEQGLLDTTAIIVTSDHGGPTGDFNHGSSGNPENYTIPFIAWGAGVGEGIDLYTANIDSENYADPGTERIDRDGPQPIRGHDAANLSLQLLDLPALASPAANATHSLQIN